MADNLFASVSSIVVRQSKVLLVRQAYGAAKGMLIIPGGYLSEGEPVSDANENSESLFVDMHEAVLREDLTATTREILKNYMQQASGLALSDFCPAGADASGYQLYC
jgi:hypothetical protein